MPATLLHILSRSDSTQIPIRKYMCANQSDIINYFCSPNRGSKMAFRRDSVEEAAVRPLGMRMKGLWSRDVNWQSATSLARHRSISTLAVNMFSLFLYVSLSPPFCCTFQHQTGDSCLKSDPVWLFSEPVSMFSTPPFIPLQLLVLDLGGKLNQPSHSIELLPESCGLSDCLGKQMNARLPP